MNRRLIPVLVVLLAAISCSAPRRYEMRGQILGVNRDKLEVLVKHDEIVGLMPAMTMPWRVKSANLLDTIGPGDLITSELEVENNQGVITKITKLGTAKPDTPPPAAPAKPGVNYIQPGDAIPDQVLVDQDGRTRTVSEVRSGKALAITFMYTKCPVPTFCPMMDRQFAEAQTLIKDKGLSEKAHLLSVSFDPTYDTPRVLKEHGRKLHFDPAVWTFATADQDAIDRFATSLGLTLVRGEAANPAVREPQGAPSSSRGDEIGHTLRTLVIDRQGKLVKAYSGADWTAAQLVTDLEQLP
jgi:protein SCO1